MTVSPTAQATDHMMVKQWPAALHCLTIACGMDPYSAVKLVRCASPQYMDCPST